MQRISGLKELNFPGSFLYHLLVRLRNRWAQKPGALPPNNPLHLQTYGQWKCLPSEAQTDTLQDLQSAFVSDPGCPTPLPPRTGDELAERLRFTKPLCPESQSRDRSWRRYTLASLPGRVCPKHCVWEKGPGSSSHLSPAELAACGLSQSFFQRMWLLAPHAAIYSTWYTVNLFFVKMGWVFTALHMTSTHSSWLLMLHMV